jgi:phage baseplate assembly protein W
MIQGFIGHVAKNRFDLLEDVVRTIPPTPRGEMLFNRLFGCLADDYLAAKQDEHQRSTMWPF